MRDFKLVKEKAKQWKIHPSRVLALLIAGRIPEAYKLGRIWCIPDNAEDPRKAVGWPSGRKRK